MLTFEFTGVSGKMTVSDVLTSGMVGREARFELSDEWEELTKTAVFSAGSVTRAVELTGSVAVIPWEVLVSPFQKLMVGVCGSDADGTLVIPTILAEGPVIQMGADRDAETGAEIEIPAEAITVKNADVTLAGIVDSMGNAYLDVALKAVLGKEIGRTLVDADTKLTLRSPVENFGDAECEDVMEGKRFTSAAGLLAVGTRKSFSVVSSTTDTNVIETGLPSVSGAIIFRDTLQGAGLACGIYTGTTGYCFYVLNSLYCGVLKGPYFGINGGTVTWKGANSTSMAAGVTYHYIAWCE